MKQGDDNRRYGRWWMRHLGMILVLLFLATVYVIRCSAMDYQQEHLLAKGAVLVEHDTVTVQVSGPIAIDSDIPATADSLFHIGSNTKAMTATMIAMLVEEGLLDWETTVSEVWPQHSADMHPQLRQVTLHELLTHRSGIQSFTDGTEWKAVPKRSGDNRLRRIAFSQWLLSQEPAGRRGLYRYSNAGYCVASAMVEQLSGASWEQLMQERLFVPLEMQVQIGWPLDHAARQPSGHQRRKGLLRPFGREQGYSLPAEIAPAGDLSMPLGDYAKFLQLHLDGLNGNPRLLSAESFAFLHEPVGHYACGWIVLDRDRETEAGTVTERISTHDGSAGSFYIRTELSHAGDHAAAAVVNAGGDPSRELVEGLLADLLLAGTPSSGGAVPRDG